MPLSTRPSANISVGLGQAVGIGRTAGDAHLDMRDVVPPAVSSGMDRVELFFAIVAVIGFAMLTGAMIWMWLY